MRALSPAGQEAINDIAQRHGFSVEATLGMFDAVINGNGSMAQFNHPEFAGAGQWMRGGMTLVSDMFNDGLKGRVDALCIDLSNLMANQPDLIRRGSFQSQSQGDGRSRMGALSSQRRAAPELTHPLGGRTTQGVGLGALFVPPAPGTSGNWWPSDLGWPSSAGAQNGVRYAYFAQARRLTIDVGGSVTVYDTRDHQIGGFSQQQSAGGSLGFWSQHGLIDVASLPVISSSGEQPRARTPAPAAPQPASGAQESAPPAGRNQDVFAAIEKLADLRAKGIVSDDEFAAKKAELLNRI